MLVPTIFTLLLLGQAASGRQLNQVGQRGTTPESPIEPSPSASFARVEVDWAPSIEGE